MRGEGEDGEGRKGLTMDGEGDYGNIWRSARVAETLLTLHFHGGSGGGAGGG